MWSDLVPAFVAYAAASVKGHFVRQAYLLRNSYISSCSNTIRMLPDGQRVVFKLAHKQSSTKVQPMRGESFTEKCDLPHSALHTRMSRRTIMPWFFPHKKKVCALAACSFQIRSCCHPKVYKSPLKKEQQFQSVVMWICSPWLAKVVLYRCESANCVL